MSAVSPMPAFSSRTGLDGVFIQPCEEEIARIVYFVTMALLIHRTESATGRRCHYWSFYEILRTVVMTNMDRERCSGNALSTVFSTSRAEEHLAHA